MEATLGKTYATGTVKNDCDCSSHTDAQDDDYSQIKTDNAGNLYAALDHVPITKPSSSWKMPIVKPYASTSYSMPVKKLPPVIQKPANNPNLNP